MAEIVDSSGGEKKNGNMINVVLWKIGVSPKKGGFWLFPSIDIVLVCDTSFW